MQQRLQPRPQNGRTRARALGHTWIQLSRLQNIYRFQGLELEISHKPLALREALGLGPVAYELPRASKTMAPRSSIKYYYYT